jgi:hypothetical protein
VTTTLSHLDAEKQLTDACNLLGELETIHDWIIEHRLDGDYVARAWNTQHLTYSSAEDGASAMPENYLLQLQDDISSVAPESEEQVARRKALQAAEQQVRDARTKMKEEGRPGLSWSDCWSNRKKKWIRRNE